MGVLMLDGMRDAGHVALRKSGLHLMPEGEAFLQDFGIDLAALKSERRALCRSCLDWSMRREHLAGALGAALLDRIYALKWAERERRSRAVVFTAPGERRFRALFGAAHQRQ
jgi:hypothetical protein